MSKPTFESSSIFQFEDYKKYLKAHILTLPNRGRGFARGLALQLDTSSVAISQIFRGNRDFAPEQALKVSTYLGHSELEKEYFITLVLQSRSGSEHLRQYFGKKLKKIRNESSVVRSNLDKALELGEAEKAIFYSSWKYSAIRLATSFASINSVEDLRQYLGLSRDEVGEIVDFLLHSNLIEKVKGQFQLGPAFTHVGENSKHVVRHHQNWRLKAISNLDSKSADNLHYTGPMALSKKVFDKYRAEQIQLIQKLSREAITSDSELLTCLNVDWFNIQP